MNIIYIFGITILLMGGTDSLIENTKSHKNSQQRILLRKLQNFQDTKPLTWNEVLADVLVNKMGIFSFKNQDKEDVIKDAPITKERTILTDLFSNVFVVYKKFVYDAFTGKHKTNEDRLTINETPLDHKSGEDDSRNIEPEVLIQPAEVQFAEGPKSEVELVEPKYHGKITLGQSTTTESPANDNLDPGKDSNIPKINLVKQDSDLNGTAKVDTDLKGNVDPGKEESVVNCAEGFVKSETGNCVYSSLRLILAIPNQCPQGYRKDALGYCRMVFHF